MQNSEHLTWSSRLKLLLLFFVVITIALVTFSPLIALFVVTPRQDKAQTIKLQIAELTGLLAQFKRDTGRYPTTEEGFAALLIAPPGLANWHGPYLGFKKIKNPKDPWGNDYHYLQPGVHGDFDLYTLGADNAEGGTGINQDQGNWP